MINPHAILLVPSNFDRILAETPTLELTLKVMYEESVKDKTPFYYITRRTDSGLQYAAYYTKEEVEREFETVVGDRFTTNFERI